MSATRRSGLIALSDGLRAFFEANAVPAVVTPVGATQRSRDINQSVGGGARVVLIPGKFDPRTPTAIDGGTLSRNTRKRTTNPKELLCWDKLITMSVWGVDTDNLEDEEAQISATEDLLELAIEGLHSAIDPVTKRAVGVANLAWDNAPLVWTTPPLEQRFGNEVLVTFVQRGPLFGRYEEKAYPTPLIVRAAP